MKRRLVKKKRGKIKGPSGVDVARGPIGYLPKFSLMSTSSGPRVLRDEQRGFINTREGRKGPPDRKEGTTLKGGGGNEVGS